MRSIGLSFSESLADDRREADVGRSGTAARGYPFDPAAAGQKLHIAGLAKQFSVSLAAVREALSRLVADGLVQASDQRGFRVSPSLGRPAGRDANPCRHRGPGAAALDRARRPGMASSVERSFTALCAVPYTYPDDPTHHYEEWWCVTVSFTARS
jgi:hypothetical protein